MKVALLLAPELEAARMRESLRGACVAMGRDVAGLVAARDAIRRLQGERDALRERAEALARALEEALEAWEYAAKYKGEYLADKHGDFEDIARLRALLRRAP